MSHITRKNGGKKMHLSLKVTFAGTYIRLEAALLSLQENQPPPKMQSKSYASSLSVFLPTAHT